MLSCFGERRKSIALKIYLLLSKHLQIKNGQAKVYVLNEPNIYRLYKIYNLWSAFCLFLVQVQSSYHLQKYFQIHYVYFLVIILFLMGSVAQKKAQKTQPLTNNVSQTTISSERSIPKTIPLLQQPSKATVVVETNDQPSIADLYTAPLPQNLIPVVINTINNKKIEMNFDKNMTGAQLKTYIFKNFCQELKEKDMSLLYEGTIIGNNKKLSEVRIVTGSKLAITQSKLEISQAQISIAQVHGIDPISEEVGTYKMSCGHSIGRDTMTAMVRSLISCKKSEIRCPQLDENGQLCQAIWDFKTCRQIGRFTQEELCEFEQGLSQNWIRQNCKKCPNLNCCQVIYMTDLKSNRVRCPACKAYDFCYICLGKWTTNNQKFCGSETCNFRYNFLETCPWNCSFDLREKGTSNEKKKYDTPQYRACPRCSSVIEHIAACKHMRCTSCKKRFCWVCLGLEGNNGSWSCGGPFQYCGKVAQVQKIVAN